MTEKLRAQGKVQLVGLIQEQHPERCRLFMKWQQMDFPILVDSLNRIGISVVPLMWAIDEHGVVQQRRPRQDWIENEFVTTDYPEPKTEPAVEPPSAGVEAFLSGDFDAAIAAFRAETKPENAVASFRLGCSLRARHDSSNRHPGDFQAAIDAWTRASELSPGQYIFRRRLQQYGPRLMKPYPFYDWVARAQRELAARGEEVPVLTVPLEGAEIAQPARRARKAVVAVAAKAPAEPDPKAGVPKDEDSWVAFEPVVAPDPVHAGGSARIYLRFAPSTSKHVTWDNAAGGLSVWIGKQETLLPAGRLLTAKLPGQPSSKETRTLEFELSIPGDTPPGKLTLSGYGLFYVCGGDDEVCTYLRKDIQVSLQVRPPAPKTRRRRGARRRR